MDQLLRSPSLKIDRAQKHFAELLEVLHAFSATTKPEMVFDTVSDGTIVRAKINNPVPDMFDVLSGEILYNLRSALDHLACAVLLKNDPDANLADMEFPIGAGANDPRMLRRIDRFPDPIKSLVKEIKPYRSESPTLWALNKLNTIDKHRTFVPIGSVTGSVVFENATFTGTVRIDEVEAADLAVGSQVIYAHNTYFDPNNLPQVTVSVNIAFAGYKEVSSTPAVLILKDMIDLASDLLHKFEAAYFQ